MWVLCAYTGQHTSMRSQSGSMAGTYPCGTPRCRTCSSTIIEVPTQHHHKGALPVNHSSSVVYCMSCRCCPALYIGEPRCMPRECTGEHLRTIMRNPPSFPVAEHFSTPGHKIDNIENFKEVLVLGFSLGAEKIGTSRVRRRNQQCICLDKMCQNFPSWYPKVTQTKC